MNEIGSFFLKKKIIIIIFLFLLLKHRYKSTLNVAQLSILHWYIYLYLDEKR